MSGRAMRRWRWTSPPPTRRSAQPISGRAVPIGLPRRPLDPARRHRHDFRPRPPPTLDAGRTDRRGCAARDLRHPRHGTPSRLPAIHGRRARDPRRPKAVVVVAGDNRVAYGGDELSGRLEGKGAGRGRYRSCARAFRRASRPRRVSAPAAALGCPRLSYRALRAVLVDAGGNELRMRSRPVRYRARAANLPMRPRRRSSTWRARRQSRRGVRNALQQEGTCKPPPSAGERDRQVGRVASTTVSAKRGAFPGTVPVTTGRRRPAAGGLELTSSR